MNERLSQLKIGSSKKKVTIVEIESKYYSPQDKDERLYIHAVSNAGKAYKVSEIWIRDHNQEVIPRGLWLNLDDSNSALDPTSPLVRLLQHVGAADLPALIGKEVTVEPKPNGFMAIIAYEE